MERALRRRAVAEEGHGDAVVAAQLGRRGGADGDGQAGGDDAVGAEDAELRVGDVHGAAAAAVGALGAAHQLGEHAERIEPLGQAVAVAAVGGGDDVIGAQGPAGADGCRLLPDREVHETGYQPVAVELGHAFFEAADEQHAALQLQQVGGGQSVGASVDGSHGRVLY